MHAWYLTILGASYTLEIKVRIILKIPTEKLYPDFLIVLNTFMPVILINQAVNVVWRLEIAAILKNFLWPTQGARLKEFRIPKCL